MPNVLHRRALCTGFGALAAGFALHAPARDPAGLDGTWGGALNGVTGQVIIAGAAVIGFFWRDDYLEARDVIFSDDGQSLFFTFQGGHARVTRTGKTTATIDVSEGANLTRLDLRRD